MPRIVADAIGAPDAGHGGPTDSPLIRRLEDAPRRRDAHHHSGFADLGNRPVTRAGDRPASRFAPPGAARSPVPAIGSRPLRLRPGGTARSGPDR